VHNYSQAQVLSVQLWGIFKGKTWIYVAREGKTRTGRFSGAGKRCYVQFA